MTDIKRYTKAFAQALAEHLRGRVPEFTEAVSGHGGCETCGYGAPEYADLDMDRLATEIDSFVATFKPQEQQK
jgi:hypothetical protein